MRFLINRKQFCLALGIGMSSFCYADSAHNFYVTTLAILSYAKLPTPTPTLCVIDNTNISQQFILFAEKNKYQLEVRSISSESLKSTYSHVTFFNNTSPYNQQQLLNDSLNPSILSFSLNNNECEIGSAFCLFSTKSGNTLFKVNLDSLSRSKIHIDPRVLLLAKGLE